jgi:hypothetical protein
VHQLQSTREAPLELEDGRQLRVNWAHGQLPDWKVLRLVMPLGVVPLDNVPIATGLMGLPPSQLRPCARAPSCSDTSPWLLAHLFGCPAAARVAAGAGTRGARPGAV